jgi:hypothetical protein
MQASSVRYHFASLRIRGRGLALLSSVLYASLVWLASPALANRCTGTCGDGSTFDKSASSCDACRIMQCPRTCKLEGVTTCLWCGQDTQEAQQPTATTLVVRLGQNPNDPTAPTDVVNLTGGTVLRPRGGMDLPDGRVRIEIEMLQLELHGVSPIFGPVDVWQLPVPPSPGMIEDRLPGQPFPADSFFDVFFSLEMPGRSLHLGSPLHLRASIEETDTIAQDEGGPAPVTWFSESPTPLFNEAEQVAAWILSVQQTVIFQNGFAVDVDPVHSPTSWHARPERNPARADAALIFDAVSEGRAAIDVFDTTGRKVRTLVNGRVPSGSHRVRWDGRADDGQMTPPGIYFFRVETGTYVEAVKFTRF